MVKKFLLYILIIFLFSANQIMAENWIPIQANNGKTAEFDIDSFVINNNIAKYKVKQTTIDDERTFNMVTNLSYKTSAIYDMSIVDYTGKRKFENYSNNLKYLPIKEGSLNQALYRFLLYLKESNISNISNNKELQKYISKLQKKIQRSWHPNNVLGYSHPKKKAIAYVTLVVDKNGNIVSRSYQNNTNKDKEYEDFNDNLKTEISKFYTKHKTIEPLPASFKGDYAVFVIKYEYFIQDELQNNVQSDWNKVGIGYIECNKKFSGTYAILRLFTLPFKFIYGIFEDSYYDAFGK